MTDHREVVKAATEKVMGIAPSVIALAAALSVAPEKFGKALADGEVTGNYLADLTAAYVRAVVAQKKKDSK